MSIKSSKQPKDEEAGLELPKNVVAVLENLRAASDVT